MNRNAKQLVMLSMCMASMLYGASPGQGESDSLKARVAMYLEDRRVGDYGEFSSMNEYWGGYGRKPFMLELLRQGRTLEDRSLRAGVLNRVFSKGHDYPELVEPAMELIDESGRVRWHVASWLTDHKEFLDEEQLEKTRRVVLRRLESRDELDRWSVVLVERIAEKQDVKRLRRVYLRHNAQGSQYQIVDWGDPKARIMKILLTLDDSWAEGRIKAALKQKEDVNRRAWALLVIVEAEDTNWLDQVIACTKDERMINAPIGEWRVDEKPQPRRIERGYKRVCDLAVEVGWELLNVAYGEDKEPDWSFRPNIAQYLGHLHRDARTRYDHRVRVVDTTWHGPSKMFIRRHLFGYTDEQLAEARERLREFRDSHSDKPKQ